MFIVAAVRLVVGAALLGAAILAGAENGRPLAQFSFGTAMLVLVLLADPRRRFLGLRGEPTAVPDHARYDRWWEMAARAVFPSTVGVSILAAVALLFDASVAAFLAGAVAGMGVAAVVAGVKNLWWERRHGVRAFADRSRPPRLFTAPR